jgi:hypothetical protein
MSDVNSRVQTRRQNTRLLRLNYINRQPVLLGVVELTPWVSPGRPHSVVVTCLDRPQRLLDHSSDSTIVPGSSEVSSTELLTLDA